MDYLSVFENSLSTKCGHNVNCSRNETVRFVNSFTALLSTSDAEIDGTNSACPENGKIMIPASAIFPLKSL